MHHRGSESEGRDSVSVSVRDPVDQVAGGGALAALSVKPWIAVACLLILTVVALRMEGRIWWCACRTPTLFSSDINSSHNSQHLFDPYSFSHLLHGVIFLWCIHLLMPRLSLGWKVLNALVIEAGWEVIENSSIVIERYRAATASLGYMGDSIVNSTGDVLSCAVGIALARAIGWKGSVAAILMVELSMLFLIRDNLTLNVIMLIWPIDAIRNWQMAG